MTLISAFTVQAQDGSPFPLSSYEGQVLLVVNTATGCGFTPQYQELERIYTQYRDAGFTVLDFPCNQFAGQAPGTDEQIQEFCTRRYGTTFPRFSKVEVNGPGAEPLFTWLKESRGFQGFGRGARALALKALLLSRDRGYASKPDIKWNFTKFLVSRQGQVLERFEPTAPLSQVEAAVRAALD